MWLPLLVVVSIVSSCVSRDKARSDRSSDLSSVAFETEIEQAVNEGEDLPGIQSAYDLRILSDKPVFYLGSPGFEHEHTQLSPSKHKVQAFPNTIPSDKLPNGDLAPLFNGIDQYLEIESKPKLSIATTGELTFEAWIKAGVLEFVSEEGDGYVHWAGKGEEAAHEYVFRMYSKTSSSKRSNRISAHAFNLEGGLGSGAYFQENLAAKQWVHVTAVFNSNVRNKTYPSGYIKIFRDGVLKQTVSLAQSKISPQAAKAPLRIGTGDKKSFFKGSIGKLAIFDRELGAETIQEHFKAMRKEK